MDRYYSKNKQRIILNGGSSALKLLLIDDSVNFQNVVTSHLTINEC